jgi:hypothetical protein
VFSKLELLRDGVIAPGMKRMTAQNAPGSQIEALEKAMPLKRLIPIPGAGGGIYAG